MKIAKNLGIWLDNAHAHLMEFTTNPIEINTVASTSLQKIKGKTIGLTRLVLQIKQQKEQVAYYKKLGEAIKLYEEVVLFGPTDAKMELLNMLRSDHHFADITIEIEHADTMSEHQQHAFVRDYFQKQSHLVS